MGLRPTFPTLPHPDYVTWNYTGQDCSPFELEVVDIKRLTIAGYLLDRTLC